MKKFMLYKEEKMKQKNKRIVNSSKSLATVRESYSLGKRGSHGITLVALVITIIVLMILAGVSLSFVLGDNGILKKSQESADAYKNKAGEESNTLDMVNGYLENMMGNTTGGGGSTNPAAGTTVTKPGNWTSTEVTPIADGKGGTVPLPGGFHYVGGDIETGLVISDKQGDTLDSSGVTMGNQFVWIPVSGEADLTRTKFDTTTGQPTTGLDTRYTEPYANGYATEKSEYDTMKAQVLKYGGFYIGRFEAGVGSTTLRKKVTTAQPVVCKKGVAPYNYVPWGKAMNDASEIEGQSGAVYLAKSFASQHNYTSVTSTLTYGCEWDAMCRYIGDSQRTTSEKSAPELTGSVATDVSKNIYDLAGNCFEWTMEAGTTDGRVRRGGCYYANPVSNRYYSNPTFDYDNDSFRPTLYIK